MPHRRWLLVPVVLALAATLLPTAGPPSAQALSSATTVDVAATSTGPEPGADALALTSLRQETDEVFYFVMPDRFANGDSSNDTAGIPGDRLDHGFDPTDKGFFHGGDLAGLRDKLDYIEDLGVTAIWMTPSFKNRPVQGIGTDDVSAGYHGYWITDFTQVDPHFGTNAELKDFIATAHDRGIKVFFDIITNHTADIIQYAEGEYAYRGKAAYPYLDADGFPFDDADYAGTDDFPEPDPEVSFPYTPVFASQADAQIKVPAWLNDPTMYHNRGNSTFTGESSTYGDFFGLDDLFTERPEVVDGMIDIHENWISEFGIDGFRVDTVKHVNTEFWQEFAPAILDHAAAEDDDDFFLFGEVFDSNPAFLSTYTTEARLPAVLDFGFQAAATGFAAQSSPTTGLRDFFAADDYYIDDDSNAYSLPTFLGNHDMGRIGRFIAQANPDADDAELRRRSLLAHELMYFVRGMPVVYYGDEQGFTGDGGDKDARQDMFPSQVASYNDDDLIGTDATTAVANYDQSHPIYSALAELAEVREQHPALRSGAQVHRYAHDAAGVYAFSRMDDVEQLEYVVAVNNAEEARSVTIPTYSAGMTFSAVYPAGQAALTSGPQAGLAVTVPALSAVVYRADAPVEPSGEAPDVSLTVPAEGAQVTGRAEIGVEVGGNGFAQVTFAVRAGDASEWTVVGTDDNAPYRVFYDTEALESRTPLALKAVVLDNAGNIDTDRSSAVVGASEEPGTGPGGSPDHAVIHYVRADGDYGDETGYGLHLWGDVAEGEVTTWPQVKPFAGEDDYGRFAWVELAPGATQVNFIVHKGETKDVEADRSFNPAVTPEIWLREGDPEIYESQAEAQGFVELGYHRPDGDYDGWGLHLWGEGLAEGVPTEWAAPRMPDEIDEYGARWRVPIAEATQPVNFIVHRGDEKDTEEDRSLVPVNQPSVWLQSGDPTVYGSEAAATGVAVLHYHRPDGDYEGWGLHVWAGAANPTEWTAPLEPVRTDGFGLVFEVPLVEGATELAYIIHKGDQKDLPADQLLDLETYGHEVWILSEREGYLLPMIGGGGPDADLTEQRAHWLTRDVLVWDIEASSFRDYALHTAADGGLEVTPEGLLGGDTLRLGYVRPTLAEVSAQLAVKWPHLAGYAVFRVHPDDVDQMPDALRGQLAVSESADGRLLTATGVQIPGVLDDLYANDADLGVTWDDEVPTLAVWAPTARSVRLHLFDDPEQDEASAEVVAMQRDDDTGVWRVTGDPAWDRRFYLYEVEVYAPSTGQVERNLVTDPYSHSLSTNSTRSQIVDLSDRDLAPGGFQRLRKPPLAAPEDIALYELHVRDFSISDETVPKDLRGTYAAFTRRGSDGMRHLRRLARNGMTHVHLLPVFDIATIQEVRALQLDPRGMPGCEQMASFPPDSEAQQACVEAVKDSDGFNWGYDPFHYTTPEGSYATDPQGTPRIAEFREMVAALNRTGLRVVMDVVYNHTAQSGQGEKSVVDKVVPGYYHRLLEDGTIATSTCCQNTATEHAMMEKLMVDSVVTWATDYKVDGFRFDLMGHHSKANMLAVREALDELTPADDGVDGSKIYVYGEGWNFGEVADGARFEQATQRNLAGTGIGTFNDRLRDAVRGGGPFDTDPRNQGFGSGLYTDPNEAPQDGEQAQLDELLLSMDQIRVGLAGNLRDYTFINRNGERVTGAEVPYGGAPTGYTADPQENIVYVSAHDNETLFDALAFKLPQDTPMGERGRMQTVALSTVAFAQGVPFFHAGTEMLRSKSLDRNSYNSGDWFNRLDYSYESNNFGVGLPPASENAAKWEYMRPLLADLGLQPGRRAIRASVARFSELLEIRDSSPLFRLRTAEQVQRRVAFHNTGTGQRPGLIVMTISDVEGEDLDRKARSITVVFNASDTEQRFTVDELRGHDLRQHPVQRRSRDARVRRAQFRWMSGEFRVPARTTAVFVEPQRGRLR